MTVARVPVTLEPGTAAWRRLVRGPTADGIAYPGVPVLIAFPDLPRAHAREVVLDAASLDAAPSVLQVEAEDVSASAVVDARRAARVVIPPSAHAGLRLGIQAQHRAPPARIQRVTVRGAWPPPLLAVLIAAVTGMVVFAAARVEEVAGRGGLALGLVGAAGAAVVFMAATGAFALGWPAAWLAVPAALTATAIVVAARAPGRRRIAGAAALVAALAFGAGARWVLAPVPGSWDMDYYRVWIETALERGVTGVYGPPLDRSALEAAIGGPGPFWSPRRGDRVFTIDYPPLAVAAWSAAVGLTRPEEHGEWSVALKLPAMAGDVAAVLLLALLWPGGRAGARAAALYWAVPSSWLSSAALGYLDGAYVPILLLSAFCAATGRAVPAGAALAAAAMIKPTALVASPAIAVALRAPRKILIAVGAGVATVALVLLPFALDGTAGAAIAQVRKILDQQRLSAGYANPWWIAGALLSGESARVPVLKLDAVPFPAKAIGIVLFAGAAFVIGRALARSRGVAPTVAACGALFGAYAVLATSVHANHPHPLALLLIAAAAAGAAPRWPAAVLALGYALNILFDEGLGRVAGPRYGILAQADRWVDALRFGAGLDLSLALAVAHTLAFAALLAWLVRRSRGRSQVTESRPSS